MGTMAAVAVGGAAGATARYAIDRFIEERSDSLFPWATFVINISGCLLCALLVVVVVERLHAPNWLGVGAITGFVAAYTTSRLSHSWPLRPAHDACGLRCGRHGRSDTVRSY